MTTNLVIYVVVKDIFRHSASIQSVQPRQYSFTFKTLCHCFLLLCYYYYLPSHSYCLSLYHCFLRSQCCCLPSHNYFLVSHYYYYFAYCFLLSHSCFLLSGCCNVILLKYLLLHAIVVFLFTFFFLGILINNTFDILP
jgi:hypothetical protein